MLLEDEKINELIIIGKDSNNEVMEDDIIRLWGDVLEEQDMNLYYHCQIRRSGNRG